MKLLFPIALIATAIFLASRKSKKKNPSRYDPKARTPWNSLNEGEDPTL